MTEKPTLFEIDQKFIELTEDMNTSEANKALLLLYGESAVTSWYKWKASGGTSFEIADAETLIERVSDEDLEDPSGKCMF